MDQPLAARPSQVRCRQIQADDLEAVAELLTRGFPVRSRKYWTTALQRLASRPVPGGCPRFGYLLEAAGRAVGVVLVIVAEVEGQLRANISSWYVEPDHRAYAAVLSAAAGKLKHLTYLNISAAPHTWPILEAQGYRRYSLGQFAAIPALSPRIGAKVRRLAEADRDLPDFALLQAHEDAGCVALVCAGRPFVFLPRRIKGAPFKAMQLVYARDTADFVAEAGPIGRFLLRQGALLVILDGERPIKGLPGAFFKERGPRYYKGPAKPRLNDLAFTELVLFGA
jgi:hypothetical protein